jgi:RNA polymerase sigma-70 factor (ECF subfamily)
MDEQQARDVIRGLREGRADAWRTLYDIFAERVWCGVARRLGSRSTDVADVVQETMIAAARSALNYDDSKGSLWIWLWGIARMQVALHFRKRQRHDRHVSDGRLAHWFDGVGVLPSDSLEAAELTAAVRSTLAELPEDYEMILTAKYLDGDSIEAIAGRERSTEVAIRSKLARAREAFRQVFLRSAGRKNDAEASSART